MRKEKIVNEMGLSKKFKLCCHSLEKGNLKLQLCNRFPLPWEWHLVKNYFLTAPTLNY